MPQPANQCGLLRRQIKITGAVTPHAVDVVGRIPFGIGLHVAQFDDKGRPLDAVIVSDARLEAAGP